MEELVILMLYPNCILPCPAPLFPDYDIPNRICMRRADELWAVTAFILEAA